MRFGGVGDPLAPEAGINGKANAAPDPNNTRRRVILLSNVICIPSRKSFVSKCLGLNNEVNQGSHTVVPLFPVLLKIVNQLLVKKSDPATE